MLNQAQAYSQQRDKKQTAEAGLTQNYSKLEQQPTSLPNFKDDVAGGLRRAYIRPIFGAQDLLRSVTMPTN